MSKFSCVTLSGLVIIALLAIQPARAETILFKADLKAASQVPPTTSQGTGTVNATFDTVSKVLAWKATVSGLTGNVTAAHFHGPAEVGKNAGVMVPVPGAATGSLDGTANLTDDQAKTLIAGETYFNVHTAANPGGELRGQVVRVQ